MTVTDVAKHPLWRGEDLGRAIPASPHAVSVALPRWQDVVGYEEKKPEVISSLTSGYPRFFIHRVVQELARELGQVALEGALAGRQLEERPVRLAHRLLGGLQGVGGL